MEERGSETSVEKSAAVASESGSSTSFECSSLLTVRTSPKPLEKRQRQTSRKMKEFIEQQQDEKKINKGAHAAADGKRKRQYRKREKKTNKQQQQVANVKENEKNSSNAEIADDADSLDEKDMICCICYCTVDYSDKESFDWVNDVEGNDGNKINEEKLNLISTTHPCTIDPEKNDSSVLGTKEELIVPKTDDETSNKDESPSPQVDDSSGIKIPCSSYDRNNALLICDGPGCNRCYHQRCHFQPVINVPQREWFCLICQLKEKLQTKNKGKRNRKKKSPAKGRNTHADTKLSSNANICASDLTKTAPLTVEDLDSIYRISSNLDSSGDTFAVSSKMAESQNSECVETTQYQHNSRIERFEYHSAQLKSELIEKELSRRIKSTIKRNLSTIRLCQNSIRALTETNRARKAIIDNYNKHKRLPQEIVENFFTFVQCKIRLRDLMHSLQYIIQNRDDGQIVMDWIAKLKSKEHSIPENDNNLTGSGKTSSLDISPYQVSGEMSATHTVFNNVVKSESGVSLDDPGTKLFIGKVARREPRFDIKDYDLHMDNDNNSDPTDKIKCFVCFSGHVEENNDVVMCDGKHCFRAVHMKCCIPHVTQKMLDESLTGTFFCPYCVCFATSIHYIETEFYADVRGLDDEDSKCVIDESSIQSWEQADEVFPESVEEFAVVEGWKEGKFDNRSDKIILNSLGIEISTNEGTCSNLACVDDDESDESDTDFSCKSSGQNSVSSVSDDSKGSCDIKWQIEKSEVSALSCSESESVNGDDNQTIDIKIRRSRRKIDKSNDLILNEAVDECLIDSCNIVRGKRKRTKVDYKRLNDAIFGPGGELTVHEGVDDDDEDYAFTVSRRKR